MQQPPFSPPPEQPPQFAAYPPPGQGLPQSGYPPYSAQPQGGYGYSFPPAQPKPIGKIARKYGLIFGTIMVAIALFRYALGLVAPYLAYQFHFSISAISISSFLFTVIFTFIYWGIYFCAGIFAARQMRQIRAASFACLWTSLCYFAAYCLLFVIFPLSLQNSAASRSFYLTSLTTDFAIVLFIQIGLGIGIGTLGGLLGKSLVHRETQYGAPPNTFS